MRFQNISAPPTKHSANKAPPSICFIIIYVLPNDRLIKLSMKTKRKQKKHVSYITPTKGRNTIAEFVAQVQSVLKNNQSEKKIMLNNKNI